MKRGLSKIGVSPKNQRRFHRFDCMFPIQIHLDTPGQISIINAVAKNISSGGMLVKCSAALDALTSCHVSFRVPEWFPSANRTSEVMAQARILHASAASLTFGIAFSQPL
ncbi:MAG: PilZ domain-containing protein [bacterium]|jgi:hypothetical protein